MGETIKGPVPALVWVMGQLRRGDHAGLLAVGSKAVRPILDVWRDAAAEDPARGAAADMAKECLGVLEAALAKRAPLIGPPFLEALALLRFRHEGGASLDTGCSTATALSETACHCAATFLDREHFLTAPPSTLKEIKPLLRTTLNYDLYLKEPLYEVIYEYLTLEAARVFCPAIGTALHTSAGLHDMLPVLRELRLPWPGSRAGRDLGEVLGADLRLGAAIARVARWYCGSASSGFSVAPWLAGFTHKAARLLLAARQPGMLECVASVVTILRDLGCDGDDDTVKACQAWIAGQPPPEGCEKDARSADELWAQIRPMGVAAHALQLRGGQASGGGSGGGGEEEEEALEALAALEGSIEHRCPVMDLSHWLGVPDFVVDDGETPVVQASPIGGPPPRGRGLFVLNGGRPKPVEFTRDTAVGDDGFLSEELHEQITETDVDNPLADYCVLVTLGVWFRDEFSAGAGLRGTLRPLAAALPAWQAEGRCTQDISWDEEEQLYTLNGYVRSVFVSTRTSDSLAAMANDKMYNCNNNQEDRKQNNLVMVPCARPSPADPEKVEFSSTWVYPRHGWHWEPGKPQELTLGYSFEDEE